MCQNAAYGIPIESSRNHRNMVLFMESGRGASSFRKSLQCLSTARRIGTIFLIDLAIDQTLYFSKHSETLSCVCSGIAKCRDWASKTLSPNRSPHFENCYFDELCCTTTKNYSEHNEIPGLGMMLQDLKYSKISKIQKIDRPIILRFHHARLLRLCLPASVTSV